MAEGRIASSMPSAPPQSPPTATLRIRLNGLSNGQCETWPAVWMLPVNGESWPGDGEIDIMEHVGHRPGVVHGTVHTGAYNHVDGTQKGQDTPIPDACQTFHRYQTRWTAEAIVFLIDDREYYRFANDGAGDKTTWPFTTPFELILNIAVGGDWGGAEGIDDAALPQRMEVDWVRVWQAE